MSANAEAGPGRGVELAKRILPFVVSAVILGALLATVDVARVFGQMDGRMASIFLPSLLVFGAVSLALEAITLVWVTPHGVLTPWTAARVKAASYLPSLIHYALGVGTVSLLLSRRSGMSLADAAGVVALISLFDLGLVLLLTAFGAAPVGIESPAVQVGVVAGAIGLIALGFVFLRAPVSLGPLDRIRELEIFRAARSTPIPALIVLGLLRLAFIGTFASLAWASLVAFGVEVPLVELLVNFAAVTLVSMIPIAVAGLGTSQVAFVYFFAPFADEETLLACSLTLSGGLILLRAAIGVLFAREFTREALAAQDPDGPEPAAAACPE